MRHDHSSPLGADMLKPTLTWNNRTGRLPSPPRRLGGSGTFSANLSAMQGGKWVWTVWGTSLQVVTGELSLLFAAFFYAVRASWKMRTDWNVLAPGCGALSSAIPRRECSNGFSNGDSGMLSRCDKRSKEEESWTSSPFVALRLLLMLLLSIAIYCYLLLSIANSRVVAILD